VDLDEYAKKRSTTIQFPAQTVKVLFPFKESGFCAGGMNRLNLFSRYMTWTVVEHQRISAGEKSVLPYQATVNSANWPD